LPLGAAVYAWGFEKARWADSEFSPYGSTEGNDDEDE
jgi:hypothetical protein